jgi:hypothetical protein
MSLQTLIRKPGGPVAVAMSGKPLFPIGTGAEGARIVLGERCARIIASIP